MPALSEPSMGNCPQHFNILLGAGPRPWVWCPPRRRCVVHQRRGQRCGETIRSFCGLTPTEGEWVRTARRQGADTSDVYDEADCQPGRTLGHGTVAAAAVHSTAWLPAPRWLQGGIRILAGVRGGGSSLHPRHRVHEEEPYRSNRVDAYVHVPWLRGSGSRTQTDSICVRQRLHGILDRIVATTY